MLNEKERIECGTAEGFLALYNSHFATSFVIVCHGGEPDVLCEDSDGAILKLEITAAEDDPRDIQAILGRSDHKSLEKLAEHNRAVAEGRKKPKFTSFDSAIATLKNRIKAKLRKDYGRNVALVVRDTSGCDWEWNEAADSIAEMVKETRNPFDKGIWVLSRSKDKLFLMIE